MDDGCFACFAGGGGSGFGASGVLRVKVDAGAAANRRVVEKHRSESAIFVDRTIPDLEDISNWHSDRAERAALGTIVAMIDVIEVVRGSRCSRSEVAICRAHFTRSRGYRNATYM